MASAALANRYEIQDRLGAGGMGAVYRAKDRLTGNSVALKKVPLPQISANGIQDEMTLALAQEFRLLASLRHPSIISVLDYGFDAQRQPFFTMELLDDAPPITFYGRYLPLERQIDLIRQMFEALRYLHRRGIIHRDVKPDNVLVANGQVRVLDFGLAQEGAGSQPAGTLYYIAPEVIQGSPATEVADLYAAGIVAYQMLTGKHPFPAQNPGSYIKMLLTDEPNLDALPAVPALQAILRQALDRDPENRYPSADAILKALNAAGYASPQESAALRESYLQAARFVGRENELALLNDALHNLTGATQGNAPVTNIDPENVKSHGRVSNPPLQQPSIETLHKTPLPASGEGSGVGFGSAWLIGGESGVGKSRLVDEVRIRAMVAGVLMLRGQAVSGSRRPYEELREPLRRLILSTPLTDAEAGILKSLVPDIETLMQRPVEDATRLDGAGSQHRLAQTILELFRRQSSPVLLILEDLHWMAEGSDILRLLTEHITGLPLMLIATYRDDERPSLPDELPGFRPIKLNRLSDEAIEQLSASMLGDNGRMPGVVELLKRETEGNVFFIVEVVRTLAEEAGYLSLVGQKTLPQKVFAGGIRTVVQRRLDAVPDSAHRVLVLAALLGREPDLTVLRALEADVDTVLMQAGAAAVMTVEDGRWRFAHDKLREALLDGVFDSQPLHRRIAETMERLYAGQREKAPLLAYHWRAAGDDAREARYDVLAGELAMSSSSYRQALEFFERAQTLEVHLTRDDVLHLRLLTGDTCYTLGDYPRARELLQDCADRAPPGSTKARALNLLGNIALAFGEYDTARTALEAAVTASDDRREIGRATRSLGVVHQSTGDVTRAREDYEKALKILRDVTDVVGTAAALSNLASLAQHEQRYHDAIGLYEESIALFNAMNFLWGAAYATTSLGLTLHAAGDDTSARSRHEAAFAICQRIGHQWGMAFCSNNLSQSCLMLNDTGAAAVALHEALQITLRLNVTATLMDTLTGFAALQGLMGDAVGGVETLAFVLNHPASEPDTRKTAQRWLDRLKPQMTPQKMGAAKRRGKRATLEQITERFTKWRFVAAW